MASATAFQYPQPPGGFGASSYHSRSSPALGASPLTNSQTRIHAVTAAQAASASGKLHKRRDSRSSGKEPFGQAYTPDSSSINSSFDIPRSPGNRSRNEKLRQNLRKMTARKDDDLAIDFSKSAAENEERTGLAMYSLGSNNSGSDINTSYAARARGQSLGSFRPSEPFVHPMRQSPRPYTPPLTESRLGAVSFGEGDILGGSTRSGRSSSAASRPPLRNTVSSGSSVRFVGGEQSSTTLGRPRRGTNQSVASNHSKPRTSIDRARGLVSRPKDEPLDPATRAATINAARRAFEERQEAKNKKYEEKERRSAEKQAQKMRKRSNASARAVLVAQTTVLDEKQASEPKAIAYTQVREESPTGVVRPVSRKRAKKGGYFGFLSWLKTKLFGRGKGKKSK